MNRRIVALFVTAALLIVPALALALPSPDTLGAQRETDPAKTTRVQRAILSVPATGAQVATPALTDRRIYEFDVSGTWQYDSNSSHQADMAFSTSDGWSSASKAPGGRSLVIDGHKQADSAVLYKANHSYTGISYTGKGGTINLSIFDNNYSDGNSGSLTVTVWEISKITWTITGEKITLPSPIDPGSGPSVPPTPVPGATVPPITVGGTPVIGLAGIRTYQGSFPGGGPAWCMDLTTVAGTIQVACVADPARLGPPLDLNVGVPGVPAVTVCQTPACSFSGVSPSPVPVSGGIKKGSSLVLSLSWTGDESKLWNYATLNGTSLTQRSSGWAPFEPTRDIGWFTNEVAAGNLGASLTACVQNPAPDTTCSHKQTVTIPGIGQLLQAMFHTSANGI